MLLPVLLPVLPPLPLPFAPPAPYQRPLLPPQVGETGLAYARRGGSILAWNAMAALLELAGQPEPSLYLISGLAPPPPPLPPPPPAYDLADGSSDGVARVEPRSPPRSPAGTTLSPSPSPESPPSPAPPCSACGLAPPLCPASVPARCLTCDQAFAPGAVGYPEVQTEPAETWTPPGWPVEAGISDGDGHPLTWGRVAYAHARLALVITLTSDAPRQKIDARTAAYFLPGAVGYLAVNNVRYFMIRQVNPGLLVIIWNLKIVVIGLLYMLPPFRRLFRGHQWAGALLLVLGSIYAGWATPTEAAALGAVGAAVFAAFEGRLSFRLLNASAEASTSMKQPVGTCMSQTLQAVLS